MFRLRLRAGRRPAVLCVLFLLCTNAPTLAQSPGQEPAPPADPPASSPTPWYQAVSFNGFVASSVVVNANHPASGTNPFRVFDTRDRSFVLDEVEFVVQQATSSSQRVGFRTDITLGSSISRVTASAGLFRDDAGDAGDLDIHQAFVSYVAPAGRGLRIDVGKFVTHIGYEVVDGFDGYNDTHSRGLLFGYAEPITHTGVRASYAFSGAVSGQAAIVNGWDNVVDNNSGKSIGLQLAVTPSSRASVTVNYMGGPEQASTNAHLRHLLDVIAVGKLKPSLTLAANYDYGREAAVPLAESAGGGVMDSTWQGLAIYARQSVTERLGLVLRGEWFDNPQGARTGKAQTLHELTFTPEFKIDPRFIVRGDLRQDRSNRAVFERHDGTFTTHQFTVSLNVLFIF